MSEPTDHLGREVSGEDQPQTVDDFAAEQGNLSDEDQAQADEQEQAAGSGEQGKQEA